MSEQVQGSCQFGLCHARDLPESQSSNTPNGRLNLTVKTHNTPTTRSSGPGATSINTTVLRRHL
ncbi:hypothetical protein BS17DRAFT_780217 [Gyrodon lividus]|nr:hypothetical protein BS17DRAFT_780217 [Gyrodon lividus]